VPQPKRYQFHDSQSALETVAEVRRHVLSERRRILTADETVAMLRETIARIQAADAARLGATDSQPMTYPPTQGTMQMPEAKRYVVTARTRTADAMLTPPTAEESAAAGRRPYNPDMLGKVWAGDFEKTFVGYSTADKRRALDAARKALDEYAMENFGSGELGVNGLGALATDRPEEEFELPEMSRASVGDSGGAQMRRLRDQTGAEVARMQAAANKFWKR
jgi:hypothetical protein